MMREIIFISLFRTEFYTCRFVHCRVKVIKNERINEQGLLINGTLTEDNK